MKNAAKLRTLSLLTLSAIFIESTWANKPLTTELPLSNEKAHIYLLMIPDYDLKRLQSMRVRQDEDDGGNTPSFAQTGMFVGQIISGVLNFDARPLFAGSVGFVEDPNAQKNLGSFFGTIAPAMNLLLKELYNRAQMRFGFPTTPRAVQTPKPPSYVLEPIAPPPLPPVVINGMNVTTMNAAARPIDYDYDTNSTLVEAQPQQQQQTPDSWQQVIHQILRESTTTVEPLPFIRLRTTPGDDDDGEESRLIKVA